MILKRPCEHCGVAVTLHSRNASKQKWCSPECNFLSKVNIASTDSCICWPHSVVTSGYGGLTFKRKTYRTHVISYKVFNGVVPKGMLVCHSCDTPRCVNPRHLFLGTPADNMRDKMRKGRHKSLRGEASFLCKTTEETIHQIRQMLVAGALQRVIADKFGLAQTTISAIKRRIIWDHLK